MKILRSWLEDYVEINPSNEELALKLNVTGTEVEAVIGTLDKNVVVAEIKKISKHPNADRLRIAEVFDGTDNYTVVCGAPNIEVGQRVPLAKIGAKLKEMEIKKSEIRGVVSEGMLCAEDELGLGEDHSGIIILQKDYELGVPLSEYVSSDAVLELEVTPNRGDCLSHIGIAREVAAFSNQVVKKHPISIETVKKNINEKVKVSIEDKKLCSQYMARYIENVKIAPSPDWLKDKLLALGLKPINNVVDVTNYIMLDLGQPLHAFDADKVEGGEIIVRKNHTNEKIVTLDGVERKLGENVLLISDKKKAIGIAGIMGGKNSEITNETTNIIIESAEFERKVIRAGAKKLSLVTDASYRFERGIDSGSVEYALNKATKLIQEIAGGNVLLGIAKAGERPESKSLKIEYKKINNLTGLELSEQEINGLLKNLGFEVKAGTVKIPLWRHDIEIWQDLVEEVARTYGYGKIRYIPVKASSIPKKSEYYQVERIKDFLVDSGFVEIINYPYLSETEAASAKLDVSNLIEIANPVQPENKYLRNSLIPGILKTISKNSTFDPVLLFETGKVFSKKKEVRNLGIAASGKGSKEAIEKAAESLKEQFYIKENLSVTQVSSDELLSYKIRKPVVYILEIDLEQILIEKSKISDKDLSLKLSNKSVKYRPVSKFPSVTRDVAFIVDKTIDSQTIEGDIYLTSDLINRVELFDEYASDKFGEGKKNVAFHLYLQHTDRTLTDKEAEDVIKSVISSIEKKYNAKLRDK